MLFLKHLLLDFLHIDSTIVKLILALLLNIGTDHYDEHGGKEHYIEAKKKLVEHGDNIVVNKDDELCVQMLTQSSIGPMRIFWNKFFSGCLCFRTRWYFDVVYWQRNKANELSVTWYLQSYECSCSD